MQDVVVADRLSVMLTHDACPTASSYFRRASRAAMRLWMNPDLPALPQDSHRARHEHSLHPYRFRPYSAFRSSGAHRLFLAEGEI